MDMEGKTMKRLIVIIAMVGLFGCASTQTAYKGPTSYLKQGEYLNAPKVSEPANSLIDAILIGTGFIWP